jgi:hypothetical protein
MIILPLQPLPNGWGFPPAPLPVLSMPIPAVTHVIENLWEFVHLKIFLDMREFDRRSIPARHINVLPRTAKGSQRVRLGKTMTRGTCPNNCGKLAGPVSLET